MKAELVTILKRKATKILADLHTTQEPVLITEHGKPSVDLLDVAHCEMMQDRIKILVETARGASPFISSRTYPVSTALNVMTVGR